MNEVEKMRSSQLADMSVPEIQVKFEHAKRLLAKMRVMSTYDEDYRRLLEELVPIALSWTGDISRLVPIRWSVHAYRYTLPIIRWIISSVVRKRNMPIR